MKKALKIFGIILLLLVIAVIALPFIFKGKLVEMTKEEINNAVNAKVNFGDFDLSIISSFPDLTMEINDIKIEGEGAFKGTPLLAVGKVIFDVDIMTVINGEKVKVNEISIDQMHLNALVLEDGTANYDIAKASDGTEDTSGDSAPFNMRLDRYEITNSSIIYDNRSLDMYMALNDLNHSGTGDFTKDLYALTTKTTAGSVDVTYEKTHYLSKADAEINADFDITENFGHFQLKANEIRVNNLYLVAEGSVDKPKDGMNFDIDYSASKTDLKNVLSLIPKEYLADLDGITTTGKIKLDGKVEGMYDDVNLPGFTVNFQVDNGKIQYPDLPSSLDQIEVSTAVVFPGGADFDKISVDVQNFNLLVAESPINGRLLMKNPLSDPWIDASINAQVNLADIKKAVELESIKDLTGIITADVDLKGRMSTIEAEQYEDFVATGKVILQDMTMKQDSMPDLNIGIASLDFSPQKLDLKNFHATMGKSDFDLKGQIDNYLAYYLKDDMLKGSFDLKSKKIDLNEFMAESTPVENTNTGDLTADATPMAMLEIPNNIDVVLRSNIQRLHYDKVVIDQLHGDIKLRESKATMNNVKMKVLGGDVVLNGTYSTDTGQPKVDFDYDINRMDITNTAATFNTMKNFAPLVSKCTGKYSSDLAIHLDMDQNMNPLFPTITGDGDLASQKIFIKGFEPLNKIAETLQISRLATQNIENVNFNYEIKDGKVFVQPFDVMLDGIASNVSGNSALTGEIDYLIKMKVPVSKLGNNVNGYLTSLVGNINDLGLNLSIGQFVNMNLTVTGTMLQPKIKVAIAGTEGQTLQESIVNTVKEELNEAKEEAIDDAKEKAREEAAKIIAEGEKQAARVKAEAKKLADKVRVESIRAGQKLIKEATNPLAKLGAKKAAEKLEKEGEKKAKRLESEANTRADKIIADAKRKADQKLQ